MKKVLLGWLVALFLCSGAAFAQDGSWDRYYDRRDLHHDYRALAHDRRELARDYYYGDYGAARRERSEIARREWDVRHDRRDLRRDYWRDQYRDNYWRYHDYR